MVLTLSTPALPRRLPLCSSRRRRSFLVSILLVVNVSSVRSFAPPPSTSFVVRVSSSSIGRRLCVKASNQGGDGKDEGEQPQQQTTVVGGEVPRVAPTFNGKMVFPLKAMSAGLKGQNPVAAVYAVLDSSYKRGAGDGWSQTIHVGITRDLLSTLETQLSNHGPQKVAHVRGLSFAYPQRGAMEEVANRWRDMARDAGAALETGSDGKWEEKTEGKEVEIRGAGLADMFEQSMADARKGRGAVDYDDDDDDDDDDEDWLMDAVPPAASSSSGTTIVSPFSSPSSDAATVTAGVKSGGGDDGPLPFTKENVDKILDEVRPYLVADGGNVAVHSVDDDANTVSLILEGACGSCASSTVTMQMGIERVLKENFPDLTEVIEVEDPAKKEEAPTELTMQAVVDEVDRIKPAIIAMGGVVEVLSVDPTVGSVEMRFRGSNKVRQGLELAVRDVPLVRHVEFVM